MATGHIIPNDLYNSAMSASNIIKDPGSAGTIKVDISGGICNLDSTVGVARTLQSPLTVPEGVEITLVHETDGVADLDITYDGFGADANIEMDDDGDWIRLVVLSVNSVKSWHTVVKSSGVTIS